MKKYQVKVMAYTTIEIIAENEQQAQDLALESEECGRVVYGSWDTEIEGEEEIDFTINGYEVERYHYDRKNYRYEFYGKYDELICMIKSEEKDIDDIIENFGD